MIYLEISYRFFFILSSVTNYIWFWKRTLDVDSYIFLFIYLFIVLTTIKHIFYFTNYWINHFIFKFVFLNIYMYMKKFQIKIFGKFLIKSMNDKLHRVLLHEKKIQKKLTNSFQSHWHRHYPDRWLRITVFLAVTSPYTSTRDVHFFTVTTNIYQVFLESKKQKFEIFYYQIFHLFLLIVFIKVFYLLF